MSAPINAAPGYVQVGSPRTSPPRIHLMSAAELITEPVSRWEGGFMFDPPLGNPALWMKVMCGEPYDTDVPTTRRCDPVTSDTFVLLSAEVTSSFNKSTKDMYARTRDNLLAYEGVYLESAFVTGGFSGVTFPYLLDPLNAYALTSTPMNVVDAFANTEAQITLWGLNAMRPMIYVTLRAMMHLARHQLVRREGNIWLSPMDSIVVPLSRYAFSGQEPPGQPIPGTDQEYMYATTGVQIRRSELLVYPEQEPPSSGNPFGYPASAVNRQTNNIAVSTQRIYGISFVTNLTDYPVVASLIDYTIPHL